jgi:hypothetical protein
LPIFEEEWNPLGFAPRVQPGKEKRKRLKSLTLRKDAMHSKRGKKNITKQHPLPGSAVHMEPCKAPLPSVSGEGLPRDQNLTYGGGRVLAQKLHVPLLVPS